MEVWVRWWGSAPQQSSSGLLPKVSFEVRISWQRQTFGNKSPKERSSKLTSASEGLRTSVACLPAIAGNPAQPNSTFLP
jgi:hypothetical protein